MMISSVRKKEKTGSFSSSSNFSSRNKGLSSGEASGDLSCLQSKTNEESMEEESSPCPPPLTFLTKEPVKRARLIDINEWITCYLCGGYLVDATTLIDCSTLHSFCRSCILKYLNECQVSRTRPTCPVCETAFNESKPHSSLRLDRKLQDIVYKLVPGLFKRTASHAILSKEAGITFYDPGDKISLSLEYIASSSSSSSFKSSASSSPDKISQSNESSVSLKGGNKQKTDKSLKGTSSSDASTTDNKKSNAEEEVIDRKYLLCLAGMPVSLLKKFIVQKYGLDARYSVELIYNNTVLTDDLTIMDVIYIYSWPASDPMKFSYRIECQAESVKRSASSALLSSSSPSSSPSASSSSSEATFSPNSKKQKTATTTASSTPSASQVDAKNVKKNECRLMTAPAVSSGIASKNLSSASSSLSSKLMSTKLSKSTSKTTSSLGSKKQRTTSALQVDTNTRKIHPFPALNGKKSEQSVVSTPSTELPSPSSLNVCLVSPSSSYKSSKSPKSPKSPHRDHHKSNKSSHHHHHHHSSSSSSSSSSSKGSKVTFVANVTSKGITIVRDVARDTTTSPCNLLKIPKPQGGSYSSNSPGSSPAAGSTAPSMLSPSAPSPSHSYSYSSPSHSCSATAGTSLPSPSTPSLSSSSPLSPPTSSSSLCTSVSSSSSCVAGVSSLPSSSTSPSSLSASCVRQQKQQPPPESTGMKDTITKNASNTKIMPGMKQVTSSSSTEKNDQGTTPTTLEEAAKSCTTTTPSVSSSETKAEAGASFSKSSSPESSSSSSKPSCVSHASSIDVSEKEEKSKSLTGISCRISSPDSSLSSLNKSERLERETHSSSDLSSSETTKTTSLTTTAAGKKGGSLERVVSTLVSKSVSSKSCSPSPSSSSYRSIPCTTSSSSLSTKLPPAVSSTTTTAGVARISTAVSSKSSSSSSLTSCRTPGNNNSSNSQTSGVGLEVNCSSSRSSSASSSSSSLHSLNAKNNTAHSKVSSSSMLDMDRVLGRVTATSSGPSSSSSSSSLFSSPSPAGLHHRLPSYPPPPAHLPVDLKDYLAHLGRSSASTSSLIPPYRPSHVLCRPAPSRPQVLHGSSAGISRTLASSPVSSPSSSLSSSALPLSSHALAWDAMRLSHAMSSLYPSSLSRRDK